MEGTKIEWATHTFNPWVGCTKVSPGCQHCYAEALDRRWGHGRWGPKAPRQRTSVAYWRQPLRWDVKAAQTGEQVRVFCASLADVWEDRADLVEHRADLFRVIQATPALTWLLLTKRPENILRLWPAGFQPPGVDTWPNVWLGTTVEDQERADLRVPQLLRVPAALRFLSVEPLLGPVDLTRLHGLPPIGWAIVGGESGAGARPMDVAWARGVVAQCRAAGVPCFVKQLGARVLDEKADAHYADGWAEWPNGTSVVARTAEPFVPVGYRLKDTKGGDPAEWPEDLRVRQVPGGR